MVRRGRASAIVVLLLAAGPAPLRAQPAPPATQATGSLAPPATEATPPAVHLRFEGRGGVATPVGHGGLGLALGLGQRFELAIAGGADHRTGNPGAFALAARAWLLDTRRFRFGVELGASRHAGFALAQHYARPGFAESDQITYQWSHEVRADSALALRWKVTRALALALNAGLGLTTSAPATCFYQGVAGRTVAPCDDDTVPDYLRGFNPHPLRPYFELGFSYALGTEPATHRRRLASEPAPRERTPPVTAAALRDPRVGRATLGPTARTQPPGSFTMGLEELFTAHANFVVASGTEIDLRVIMPFVTVGGAVVIKHPIADAGAMRLSALGALGGLMLDNEGIGFGGAGLVGSVCIDDACGSMLSTFGLVSYWRGSRSTNSLVLGIIGTSLMVALGQNVKLIAEVDGVNEALDEPMVLGSLRLHGRSIAVDLGLGVVDSVPIPLFCLTWRAG